MGLRMVRVSAVNKVVVVALLCDILHWLLS